LSLVNDWHFSCNEKGWTSNIHGEQWIRDCFDVATREKANGQYRLLLCDGHDSHITAQFVRYCIDNKIILFVLPPHASHLLQPLDVGVFGPVKTAMSFLLSKIYATDISRLQKIEWTEIYMKARLQNIVKQNILGGWRGAGLFPLNPHRVLRLISHELTPSRQPEMDTTTPFLITSSPPDVQTLRLANKAFNEALVNSALATPLRMHGRNLGGIAEFLHADNSVLRRENAELKSVIGKRKERLSTKHRILKGKFIVSTEEIQKQLSAAERQTREKKARKGKRGTKAAVQQAEMEEEDTSDESDMEEREIQDSIVVELA
jgi:hypothetical protein